MDNSLSIFVSGVYDNLADQNSYSPTYLSGWALNPTNLGYLNNSIDACYSGIQLFGTGQIPTGYAFSPDMSSHEMALYSLYFEGFFWKNFAKFTVSGSLSASPQWSKVEEGDTRITRQLSMQPPQAAKIFNDMAKTARDEYKESVRAYKSNNAVPQQVYGTDVLGTYHQYPANYWMWRGRFNSFDGVN